MSIPLKELTEPDFDTFVSFDIETTGYGPGTADRRLWNITEIGAVKYVDGKFVDKFDTLCNSGGHILGAPENACIFGERSNDEAAGTRERFVRTSDDSVVDCDEGDRTYRHNR